MNGEFWEIAGPLTQLRANEILYGDPKRLKIFEAAALKIGHPVEKAECLICIKDSLTVLKNKYTTFIAMSKNNSGCNYTLKRNGSIPWKGTRYDNSTLTDEVAAEMLEAYPEYKKFFSVMPDKAEEKEETPKPKKKKASKKPDPVEIPVVTPE